jgi:O-antigen/teichoic acid export membrane protein
MEKLKQFFFKKNNVKQTVVKNTIWLFLGEFGSRLLKMVVYIYAARALGTSEWGIFSYALALMTLFSVMCDIGVNSVLLRETAKQTPESEKYISTSFFLKIVLSFLSAAGLLVLIFFLKNEAGVRVVIPIVALMLFLDSMREFGFALNRAFENMEVEAATKIISNIALVVAGFIFISHFRTAVSVAWAYVVAGVVGIVIMYFSIRFHLTNLLPNFRKNLLVPIFKEGWPIATVGIFGTIMTSIDTIILGWFKNSHEIGLYSAAQKPIQLIYLVPGLVSTALMPVFSRLSSTDKEKMRLVVGRAVMFSLAFSVPISVGGILFGSEIITLLFGASYAGAANIFKIMVPAILAGAPGVIVSNAIFAEGKQKKILQFIIIGAIANIILCLLLIPPLGIYGGAISVTVAQLLGNIFMILSARSLPALRFEFKIKKILIASLIMAGVILLLKNHLAFIPLLILATFVYIASLVVLKEPVIEELRSILLT